MTDEAGNPPAPRSPGAIARALASLDLSARQFAEALWLAAVLPADALRAGGAVRRPAAAPSAGSPGAAVQAAAAAGPASSEPAGPTKAEPPAVIPERPQRALSVVDPGAGSGGAVFHTPMPGALPRSLDLVRALRPLRRRKPSRRRVGLDLPATIRRVTDEGVWLPVFAPRADRAFQLALVIDTAASMDVWRATVRELTRLLEQTGTFDAVRTWGWNSAVAPSRLSSPPSRHPHCAGHPPGEVLNPSAAAQLLLFVTDCVAPAWEDGRAGTLIAKWASRATVALVQLLPDTMWSRTGLATSWPVTLTPRGAGRPSISGEISAVNLPVITLDPRQVHAWSRLIVGTGGAAVDGRALPLTALEPEGDEEAERTGGGEGGTVGPAERVRRFMSVAPPAARELARMLSVMQLVNLPLIRLVREAMLRDRATQVHEAEVLLGGLLRGADTTAGVSDGVVGGGDGDDPNRVIYRFHEGVRELLHDSLPSGTSVAVRRRVSDYIDAHAGQMRSFEAWIAAPAGDSFAVIDGPGGAEKPAAGEPQRLQLENLPRNALLAFAARCARRALPLFKWTSDTPGVPAVVRSMIVFVRDLESAAAHDLTPRVRLGAVSALGAALPSSLEALRPLLDVLRGGSRRKTWDVRACRQYASDIHAALTNGVWSRPFWRQVFDAMEQDGKRLRTLANDARSRIAVGPDHFGPMWPNGEPAGWPGPRIKAGPKPLVAVAGRAPKVSDPLVVAARFLGESLARHGFRILTDGAPGIDVEAMLGLAETVYAAGHDPVDFIVCPHVVPAAATADVAGLLRDVRAGMPWESYVPDAIALVILSGGRGTGRCIEVMRNWGRPVLPIGDTGGKAQAVHHELLRSAAGKDGPRAGGLTRDEIVRLGDPVPGVVDQAILILERLASLPRAASTTSAPVFVSAAEADGPDGVPGEEELSKLPRASLVALAARTALRVRPLFDVAWPTAPPEMRRLLDEAIDTAASCATEGVTLKDPDRFKVVAYQASVVEGTHGGIAYNAAAAASEAVNAAAAGRTEVSVSHNSAHACRAAGAFSADALDGVRRAIRADFEIISDVIARGATTVLAEVFGPMWPDGAPAGWPVTALTGPGAVAPARWVVVLGPESQPLPPDIHVACERLGERLANAGWGLLILGFPGVDHAVSRAFAIARARAGLPADPALRSGGTSGAKDGLRADVAGADAVVTVGQASRSWELIAREAQRRDKPVLSLAATGKGARGGADKLIGDLRQRFEAMPPAHRFLDRADVFDVVKQAAVADERLRRTFLLFRTPEQQTWLVTTSKNLYCLLDDADTRKSGRVVQWRKRLNRQATFRAVAHSSRGDSGAVDLGRRRNYYYSLDLHPDPRRLDRDLKELVADAFEWRHINPD